VDENVRPDVIIVSTSINKRPTAYAEWAQHGHLIVAADQESNPELKEYVEALGGDFLTAEEQHDRWPKLSEAIGWRSIQRRNLAIAAAHELRPGIIVTVDDDNVPAADFFTHVKNAMSGPHQFPVTYPIGGGGGLFNPGMLCAPAVRARGLPYDQYDSTFGTRDFDVPTPSDIAVVAALWTGDPDVDAITRVTGGDRHVCNARQAIIDPHIFAPLNSQSTAYRGDLAILMGVWPGIGRYDDIWAGYVAEHVLAQMENQYVQFGGAMVHQKRNDHDPWNDVEAELHGYRHTGRFLSALRDIEHSDRRDVDSLYYETIRALFDHVNFIPEVTAAFFPRWFEVMIT